ncbi:DASH complex subunit Dad2-domain-containing protein [Gongronella butleri]|nr:DASH complex subunit Dad2-domain-containing protein [Gongronella butleri]
MIPDSAQAAATRKKLASTTKMSLINEKQQELDELVQIKDLSELLVRHFEQLTQSVHNLADGSQGVSQVLGNWDYVFRTMGSMNTDPGSSEINTIVKLPILNCDSSNIPADTNKE